MSLLDIASLMRRHVVAVMIVLVLAASLGYEFKHAKPIYSDSATLVLRTSADPFGVGKALVVTADLITRSMMSPQSEQLVHRAGGSAGYQVNLVNLHNIEYPNYSVPYITVSATARDPGDAEQTFAAVMKVLSNELKMAQARDGVDRANQVGAHVMSGTAGAVPLSGYPKRTFGALAVLTVIAAFLVAAFLDKRPARLRDFRRLDRWRRRTSRQGKAAGPERNRIPPAREAGHRYRYRPSLFRSGVAARTVIYQDFP